MKLNKKVNMPIQGKSIIRKGTNSGYTGNMAASRDCSACCSLSSNCPGCVCSLV